MNVSNAFPYEGKAARRSRDWMRQTSIRITTASSIDGSRLLTATSYKFDTPVSGGAYQDARKVTLVWNDA